MSEFNFMLTGGDGGITGTIIMLVLMFGLLYFFMIRPQKKQEKKDAEMREALAVGDEVTTIGGIIGKVISIKGETFVLETTKQKTQIRFLKGAIRSVDVRAADLAAAVMETKDAPKAEGEEAPVAEIEAPKEKKSGSKKSKAKAEAAVKEEPVDAPAEEKSEN